MWIKYTETQYINVATASIFKIIDESAGKFTLWLGSLAFNFTDKELLPQVKKYIMDDMAILEA